MRCLLCHQPLTQNWVLSQLVGGAPVRLPRICANCAAQFDPIDPATACPGCGRADSPTLCADCQRWQASGEILLHHRAKFQYTPAMKALIYQFKGLGDYRLAGAFADLPRPGRAGDVLVPLPSEPGHWRERGFDPVLALFGHWGLTPLLAKADTAAPQASKTRAQRLATPQSFTVVRPLPRRRIVLLDDVYTTGRTLYHAADALRAAGFIGEVVSFSLIR